MIDGTPAKHARTGEFRMSRVSIPDRDQLPLDERRFYDAVLAMRRSPISGPFIVLLNSSPDLAARFAQLGHYFHSRGQADESILAMRVRTFMAMIGSRALDAPYEWSAWVGWAIDAGVPQETVDAIRDRKPLDALTAEDSLVLEFCAQLVGGDHHVSNAVFAQAREHFGVQALVELVGTLGYFAMIAYPLNAFEMEMTAAQKAKRKPFEALRYDSQPKESLSVAPTGPLQMSPRTKAGSARLPLVTEHEDLPPPLQHFFDRIVRNRGRVDAPYQVLLNSPDFAERVAYVASYFLYESPLAAVPKALTWLVTAREFDCAYAWQAARVLARKAGVEQRSIDALGNRDVPSSLNPEQRALCNFCHQLLRGNHHVNDATYQAVLEWLGLKAVVQVAATLGYVAMMSIIANAFELDVPSENPELVL
jgi:4-carboxymuconolactone decarboxylase